MFKRGVILICILIFVCSFHSVNATYKPTGTIFVTSDTFTGDLGGINGADAICQNAANDAQLEGTWIAMLAYMDGNDPVSILDRIPFGGPFYNMDGNVVAQQRIEYMGEAPSGLFFVSYPLYIHTNGNYLDNVVNKNENGNAVPNDRRVWSGSYAMDNYIISSDFSCNNWNDVHIDDGYGRETIRGIYGIPDNTKTKTWIDSGVSGCEYEKSLYCIRTDVSGISHHVFVSEIIFSGGNLGGLEGAHEKCRTEARIAGLEGWWKAWLSSTSESIDAKDFLKHYSTTYGCVPNDQGQSSIIVNNWNDLTDGGLDTQIICNAEGETENIQGIPFVYTGTGTDGSATGHDCNGFTSNSGNALGRVGIFDEDNDNWDTPDDWTTAMNRYCNLAGRIYCFQQELDGDADEFDCEISNGLWVEENYCKIDGGCDTFHDYDFDGGFCCGDDYPEYPFRGGDNVLRCCIEDEMEGIDYAGTCSDHIDNDCDGLEDGNDPDCNAVFSINVISNNACLNNNINFNVRLTRYLGELNLNNVVMHDGIYNSNNQLQYTQDVSCQSINGNICTSSYSRSNLAIGEYHHSIYIEGYDNIFVGGNFNVLSNDNELCCVDEGEIPGDGEVCCDGLPTDGPNGGCGCPSGFTPSAGKCIPGGEICYSSDPNEREDEEGNRILACAFEWFTGSIIERTLWWGDASNINLFDCFITEEDIITKSCCPYITYNNKDYGEYKDIEVY